MALEPNKCQKEVSKTNGCRICKSAGNSVFEFSCMIVENNDQIMNDIRITCVAQLQPLLYIRLHLTFQLHKQSSWTTWKVWLTKKHKKRLRTSILSDGHCS